MIHEIAISNFKSLRDVRVKLSPLTVLIGRSGTGKSNFIDAIRFLKAVLLQQHDGLVSHWQGWPGTLSATCLGEEIELAFRLTFDIPGNDERGIYEFGFRFGKNRRLSGYIREALRIGKKICFAHDAGGWQKQPGIVPLPQPSGIMLPQLFGVPEIRTAYLVLTQGLSSFDFPGDVLCDPSKPRGTTLERGGENFIGVLAAIVNDISDFDRFKEMLAALKRINRSITTLDIPQDVSRVVVGHEVGPNRTLSLGLAQESEGFRRFLAHLIALYQKPRGMTFLFEEPEKGIYPGALRVLVESFRRFIERERGQVIMTTHSPELLDCVKPEEIRVVEMHGYETKIGPVSHSQLEALREHLLTTGELLTADEARISDAPQSAS